MTWASTKGWQWDHHITRVDLLMDHWFSKVCKTCDYCRPFFINSFWLVWNYQTEGGILQLRRAHDYHSLPAQQVDLVLKLADLNDKAN